MAYFLLTKNEYNDQSVDTDQFIAWSFDNAKCIVEIDQDENLEKYVQRFETANECNEWRYNENTEEWRNWISEEDFLDS